MAGEEVFCRSVDNEVRDEEEWQLQCSKIMERVGAMVVEEDGEVRDGVIRIGGLDISFFKDSQRAVAAVVVCECPDMRVVYSDFEEVIISEPYVPGYLALRECQPLMGLVRKLKKQAPGVYPDYILVDGNGRLHPAEAGLACHVGVELDMPVVGVAKNLLCLDGLSKDGVLQGLAALRAQNGSGAKNHDLILPLTGDSGKSWGCAVCTRGSSRPLFVSIGHKVTLDTAVNIVRQCCLYRIPEPVRQADLMSREHIRRVQARLL